MKINEYCLSFDMKIENFIKKPKKIKIIQTLSCAQN